MHYPQGHEPNIWIPNPSDRAHRFVLGHVPDEPTVQGPLVAICMNPSHANHEIADRTVNRLIRASEDREEGYLGWMVLNLYPERATRPSELRTYKSMLSAANCEAIESVLRQHKATEVLGAWGDIVHPTIGRAKQDVISMLQRLGVSLFSFDPPTMRGESRHPTPRTGPLPMLGPKRYF